MADDGSRPGKASGSGKTLLLNWGPTVLFSIVLPWITYGQLTDHGVRPETALLIISGWPVVEMILYYALHRRLDEFSVLILLTLLLGAAGSLVYSSTKLLFLKDSAVTGLVGTAYLVSLFMARPLMFYFGRKFATDGTPEGIARWNGFWDAYPGFRKSQRRLTAVWGVAFLVEAGIKAALTFVLDTATMVGVANVLPFAFLAGLMFYTIRTAKKGRARMQAAHGDGQAGHPAQTARTARTARTNDAEATDQPAQQVPTSAS
ncbi:VC0807 family protein [Streptomyces sp. MST-110588]|uniref:VC0807 family protein n=1 Tax=Streptomyces sp. MST-110588 TaxID=2833628 RepID=UPI001F5D4543|nr:VC0807 family protein [Streptomyces sp. MST-110588]UNO41913.1 hypothetical protein KGS77_23175 [Streptomyces sp. MST-110588]